MGHPLILETTFLVDLEREINRGVTGPAQRLLERHERSRLYITFTVAGELAAGISMEPRKVWEDFLTPFRVLTCTRDVCWMYGRTYRYLQANGLLIGTNDLWIAATALSYGLPVVTRNAKHYRRVPSLEVLGYES